MQTKEFGWTKTLWLTIPVSLRGSWCQSKHMPRALEGLYFPFHFSLLTESMTSCLTIYMSRFLIYSCFCNGFFSQFYFTFILFWFTLFSWLNRYSKAHDRPPYVLYLIFFLLTFQAACTLQFLFILVFNMQLAYWMPKWRPTVKLLLKLSSAAA